MTLKAIRLCTFFAGFLFLASAFILLRLQLNQQLWGHWPLLQFVSTWLLIVFLTKKKFLIDKQYFRRFLLSTFSGFLLALGFPPFPLPFLLFIAMVPLLLALDAKTREGDHGGYFFLVFHTFLLWNILSTFWVANTAYFAGIYANLVNALLMSLPVMAFLYVRKSIGTGVALGAFVAIWITFEFLHMRWELHWPWLTLGNGLAKMPSGIQWYSFTGVLGGSAWILIVNYLISINFNEKRVVKWLIPFLWFFIPFIGSLVVYINYTESGEELNVVTVQPNLEPHYEKFVYSEDLKIDKSLDLITAAITPETDYVILPETSFSHIDMNFPLQSHAVRQLYQFAQQRGVAVITGLDGYRFLENEDEIALSTTRPILRQGGRTEYLEAYNCAIQIDEDGDIQECYKEKYVPGAEYFPFKKVLFFLKPLVDKLGGSLYGYRIRDNYAVFTSGESTVAPVICYESIFGEYTSKLIRKGAELIFVLTNDGWWDNTAGHRQHTDYARLRAIETRRNVVRSANMGNCCLIDGRGDIYEKTSYGEEGAIEVTARKNQEITFYVKWGDVLGRISLLITLLLLARALISRFWR